MAVFKTVLFVGTRILEILTLIVVIAMTGYFVHPYVKNHEDVPGRLLCLFIVSILACAWALLTMFSFHRYRSTSLFLVGIDTAFVGAFIASVVLLRAIAHSNCLNFNIPISISYGSHTAGNTDGYWFRGNKHCTMMKIAWIFGIVNCVLFAITAVLAWSIYRSHRQEVVVVHHKESRRSGSSDYVTTDRRRHHHHRHHHSSGSRV